MAEQLPLSLRAQLFTHLATYEQAGVPLLTALQSLQLPAPWQRPLAQCRRLVEQGSDLAAAGRRSALLTPLEIELLQAAQQAGSPAPLFQRLAEQYRWQLQQRQALISRLYLPGATLLLALLIQPLPALVGGQLGLVGYLGAVLLPLSVLGMLGWLLLQLAGPAGQQRLARQAGFAAVCDRLPVLGGWLRSRVSRDYAASLGLLLESGVALVEAEQQVRQGLSLSQALAAVPLHDGTLLRARLVAGEGSGLLGEALLAYARQQGEALASRQEQLAVWLPRLVYLLLALWMAWGILSGPGILPQGLPE